MSLPFYADEGWTPVVLTLGDAWQHGVREPELLSTLPSNLRVERTRGLPLWFSRLFGVRNTGLRAWPFFLLRGARLLATEKFDLVYFSNTQFATFTLGRLWRRAFGVPYVIDVQDPWRTDYYERPGAPRPPGGWKYQFARAQAWALEGWSFRRVAGLISVSPAYLTDLRQRYPHLAQIPGEVIGFGASRTDLARAIAGSNVGPSFSREAGEIHLVYTGVAGPVMQPALTRLFESFRLYRERSEANARRIQFHFIGTSYAAPGEGTDSVLPLARAAGVADHVAERSHRIGHLEALRWQIAADALILLGSNEPAYSPSKLYPYVLTGRPILALVSRASVAEQLVRELNCGFVVDLASSDQDDPLHHFFDLAVARFPAGSLPVRHTRDFESRYLAEELTRRQCALFSRALARQPEIS